MWVPPTTRIRTSSRRSAASPTTPSSCRSAATPTTSARRVRGNTPCRWTRRKTPPASTGASQPSCAPIPRPRRCGPEQLHVAIIGAGATGVELAAELHRTTRTVVAYGLDRIDPAKDLQHHPDRGRAPHLPALPERLSNATEELLRGLDVEVLTGRQGHRGLRRWRASLPAAARPGGTRGLGGRRQGAGRPARDRRARNQPRQPARGHADASDHARPQHLRPRRLRLLPAWTARPATCRRAPRRRTSRRRTCSGRSTAGSTGKPLTAISSTATSARWCRWASIRTVGSLMGKLVGGSMMIEGYFARHDVPARSTRCTSGRCTARRRWRSSSLARALVRRTRTPREAALRQRKRMRGRERRCPIRPKHPNGRP